MAKHIKCGTLFTGLDTKAEKDQTVVVDKGMVTYAGPSAKAPKASPKDEVVDASKYFVMPGLSDVHTHLAYGNARCEEDIDIYAPVEFRALRGMFMAHRVLLAGYTNICNPGDAARVTLSIRNAINAGLFQGPRITTAGPYLTSRQGLTDWYPTWIGQPETSIGHLIRSRDEGIEEIRYQVKDGVDVIKLAMDGDTALQPNGVSKFSGLMAAFNQEELDHYTTESHRLGKKVITHARGKEATLYSARAGVDCIFHASYGDDECLDEIVKRKITICPTLTLLVNNYEFSQPTDGAGKGWADHSKFEAETAFKFLEKAHKAGVPLLTGTDTGFAITPYGEWHAKELEIYVKYLGLSEGEALRLGTSVTAGFMNDGRRLGALEAGRHADVIVFDGNPLKDISQLLDKKRFKQILLAGEPISVETHDIDYRKVSQFSYDMWSDMYTQDRVKELGNQIRTIAAE
jgi:imidazolonepropionase-like amidohydrolase